MDDVRLYSGQILPNIMPVRSHSKSRPLFGLFLTIFLCVPSLTMAAEEIVLRDGQEQYQVGLNAQVFVDQTARMSIQDILSNNQLTFAPVNSGIPGYGYSTAAYWFRIPVRNDSGRQGWLLEVAYPLLDYVDLYAPGPEGYTRSLSGDLRPYAVRDVAHRNPVFQLKPPVGRSGVYYLRVQTASAFRLPMTVWRSDVFQKHEYRRQLVMGAFFGIFLLVFFHNLFVWISLADRSLFYYLGMICTLGVYHFVYAGYALEFLWTDAPYWADRAPLFFSSIAQLWGFLFCRSFLNLKRYAPRLDRLVGAAAVVSALTALATLTLGYTFAAQLILVLSTFSMITHLITGGIARWRGYAPARHYILAAVMMLSGGVLSIIMHLGWIPEIWPARYGFQLGSLWLVLFFSFAISDRVHHLRLKAEAARAEAVNHLNEVTRLRDSFVANLQSQVDARTAELRKFQLAVEQSPAIIIITDAKGVIEYVNRSFCEQTGYSFAEARGSTPALLKSETHDADTFTRLWRTISSGAVWRGELHNRRKDGELRWVSSMIAPLRDTDGGITHYIGISEDISKRKSLERLRSETANIIHHDLKNPASSILGLSELLLEDHPEIAGESREYVRMIEQSAGKLLRRLSFLLDLQRIEAGEYLLQPERVNLAALLRDALLDLEATRKMYAVDIHIEITGRSLPELNDYPLRGEQILLASLFGNLLLNALEASPRNGQVRVAVEKADSGHSISIHNQGAIPEEVRDRFFDPYVTGRKTGGTGLGTYAALLIARLHGGRISYTTSSDDGTRLVVFLPDNIPVDIGNLP